MKHRNDTTVCNIKVSKTINKIQSLKHINSWIFTQISIYVHVIKDAQM